MFSALEFLQKFRAKREASEPAQLSVLGPAGHRGGVQQVSSSWEHGARWGFLMTWMDGVSGSRGNRLGRIDRRLKGMGERGGRGQHKGGRPFGRAWSGPRGRVTTNGFCVRERKASQIACCCAIYPHSGMAGSQTGPPVQRRNLSNYTLHTR